MSEPSSKEFSVAWCVASVGLYTAAEILLGKFLGPLIVGTYVSPMLHLRVMTGMHLASFFLGGCAVGVISPGVRLAEPAVGAFVSVFISMLMSVFMPTPWMNMSMGKLLVGGGIAFFLALAGAWTGEKWMGNVAQDRSTARGRIRGQLWEGEDPFMVPRQRSREYSDR
ncbi:MAG: hypothetical protein HY904_10450 [Deltaproteobacteria bacterium]|nr:hypothetical protein [Deltaproteobacteria bacterium]